jgi:hypothetical protein
MAFIAINIRPQSFSFDSVESIESIDYSLRPNQYLSPSESYPIELEQQYLQYRSNIPFIQDDLEKVLKQKKQLQNELKVMNTSCRWIYDHDYFACLHYKKNELECIKSEYHVYDKMLTREINDLRELENEIRCLSWTEPETTRPMYLFKISEKDSQKIVSQKRQPSEIIRRKKEKSLQNLDTHWNRNKRKNIREMNKILYESQEKMPKKFNKIRKYHSRKFDMEY